MDTQTIQLCVHRDMYKEAGKRAENHLRQRNEKSEPDKPSNSAAGLRAGVGARLVQP